MHEDPVEARIIAGWRRTYNRSTLDKRKKLTEPTFLSTILGAERPAEALHRHESATQSERAPEPASPIRNPIRRRLCEI